jgi:dimethylhistidine N-methyltransferase
MLSEFATDVKEGLSATPKYLKSKYFYDERGDELFKSIMQLDEYYLTRSEFEIFTVQKEKILSVISRDCNYFQLVEFGAGDGTKTKKLLEYFQSNKVNFKYIPIDISQNILDELTADLSSTLPELKVEGINKDYFNALKQLNSLDSSRKVVLFLGSNIGNFTGERASEFLNLLRVHMNTNDILMIGFDLVKDPEIIYQAYNDKSGVTRAFNLNLLNRINRELGGNFDISKFKHYPIYDPAAQQARSYLISKEKQSIYIESIKMEIKFASNEAIHMEISQKYSLSDIITLAQESGFEVLDNLLDCKHYYTDSLWRPI